MLIDGRQAKDGESIAVTAPVIVSFGDVASITIAPPEGFGDDHEKARAGQIAQRADLLSAAGAGSLDEARKVFARREMLESQLKGVVAELYAFGVSEETTDDALSDLQSAIIRCDAEISEALARAEIEALPEPAAIDADRRAIAAAREERRLQRKTLDASNHEHQHILEAKVTERSKLAGELDELRRTLAASLAALPDETRETDIAAAIKAHDAARTAHQQAAGALADLRTKSPPPEEKQRLANKVARLDQAIVNQKARLADLDRTISNIEGQIQSAGGDGLGERVAALDSELSQAEADVTRHERRVKVLTLLAEAISAALDESRERFYAPVIRHLKPFVSDLFPGAALELGDGFKVSGIRRDAIAPEDFAQLSDGTQEQIGVLVRLALGALLAERGTPLPIILDDALVFSDDDRITRMFDALMRAGSYQQVIVLTCRVRAFATLGGTALRIAEKMNA